MKRGGPLKRSGFKRRKPKKSQMPAHKRAAWQKTRQDSFDYWGGTCQGCGKKLDRERFAGAHRHGLGRGRSRYNPEAQCSNCGLMLNTKENVAPSCLTGPCNDLIAAEWKRLVGCNRQERD